MTPQEIAAETKALMDHLKPHVPENVGVLLFLADIGVKGSVAYASTVELEDAAKLVQTWLDAVVNDTYDVKRLRALIEVAGDLVTTLASAAGFPHGAEIDPVALVDWVRGLKARADKAPRD